MCDYVTQEMQIYTTSGNEARLKVFEDTDILAIQSVSTISRCTSVALLSFWWFSLKDGCTPLMIASDRCHPSVVKVLLQAEAAINTTSQVTYCSWLRVSCDWNWDNRNPYKISIMNITTYLHYIYMHLYKIAIPQKGTLCCKLFAFSKIAAIFYWYLNKVFW